MNADHVRALAALSVAITFLRESKSKGAKAIVDELSSTHGDAVEDAVRFGELAVFAAENETDPSVDASQFVMCCFALDVTLDDLKAGEAPCIVSGRFAVRSKSGILMGPSATN